MQLRVRRLLVIVALLGAIAALGANTITVDSKTRAAMTQSGGTVMETGVVPANVKVEGEGLPIVLIHGFVEAPDRRLEFIKDFPTASRN